MLCEHPVLFFFFYRHFDHFQTRNKTNFIFAQDYCVALLIIELIGCQLKRPKPNEPLHFHTHLFYKTLLAQSGRRSLKKKKKKITVVCAYEMSLGGKK